MSVKLVKKTEIVYIARCQWETASGVTPFGLLWERKSYDDGADIVDRYATQTYNEGRFYHTWLEQITRYDDGSEDTLVVREYNRPAEPLLKRFEVTLTRDGSTERQDTFTWATTRNKAVIRVAQTFERDANSDSPVYDGWSFEVAQEPTHVPN